MKSSETKDRYNSGSSLSRTAKERTLDYLMGKIGEISDEAYLDMKKLKTTTLRELINCFEITNEGDLT